MSTMAGDSKDVSATYATGQATGPRLNVPRIGTVEKEAWTSEHEKLLQPLEQSGHLFNIFKTTANHPALMRAWWQFGLHVLSGNSLSPRDREFLILRIGWLCKSEYEWAQHVRLGKSIGLTDDDIRRISEGPNAVGLSENDRLLLCAADELRGDAMISDATWAGLSKTYDTKQMMDLVFTVGQYNLVSMALNSFGVQLDDDLEGFSNDKR